jgi:hypothetical protein
MRTTVTVVLLFGLTSPAWAADVKDLLARIKAVGREGAGNPQAAGAWQELVRTGPDSLLPILNALDDADAVATNWLRSAVDAIAEREVSAGRPLPVARLEEFIKQTRHAGTARRLAYEWLIRVDGQAPDRLLPGMLQDPSTELRRDAVERVIRGAEDLLKRGDKPGAAVAFQQALSGARDKDQVDLLAKQLQPLGVQVDLATHFGFLRQWQLAGPFDHTDGIGFAAVYPPEKGVDLTATYQGKQGAEVRWKPFATTDVYGVVDLNKAIAKHMGAVAYAYAVVDSPADRPVEIRAGSNNAVKIFLNGKQLFFREEYHHGMRMDQHVGVGTLKAGRNEVLLKVCQNEQKEDWAQSWSFQLRLCDAVGSPVPLTIAK